MAKAYSDDLRRRFLTAYDQEEGSLEELAERFVVSLGWGKKVRSQWLRTGRMERVEQRRGAPRKLLSGAAEQLRDWVLADHDVTLNWLQQKLLETSGISISRAQVARVLKRMGLRLKKSRFTPPSATRKRIAREEKSSLKSSARSLRRS